MKFRAIAIISMLLSTSGCVSSHYLDSNYTPSVDTTIRQKAIAVGTFKDTRAHKPNFMGLVRGGYGNPVQRLYFKNNASDSVEQAFRNALEYRHSLAESENSSEYTISGIIKRFDVNQLARKEANAELEIFLTNKRGERVFSREYEHKLVSGSVVSFDTGVFAKPVTLSNLLGRCLTELIDEVLSDTSLLQVVKHSPSSSTTNRVDLAQKLQALDEARQSGILTQAEYQSKRDKALAEF